MKSNSIGLIIGLLVLLAIGAIAAFFFMDEPSNDPVADGTSDAGIESTSRSRRSTNGANSQQSPSRTTPTKTTSDGASSPREAVANTGQPDPVEAKPVEKPEPVAAPVVESTTPVEEPVEVEEGVPFSVTVSGRVIDLSGAGVAGVTVTPSTTGGGEGDVARRIRREISGVSSALGRDIDLGGLMGVYALKVSGQATSDETGNYAISVSGYSPKEAPRFKFLLNATATGYGRGQSATLDMAAGEAKAGVNIEVWRPGSVTGTVMVKGKQEPFIGARVEANRTTVGSGRAMIMDMSDSPETSAVTNDQGAFEIHGLRPGTYNIVAEAEVTTSGSAMVTMMSFGSDDIGSRTARSESNRLRVTVEEGKTAGPVLLELERPDELIFRLAAPAGGDVEIKLEGGSALGVASVMMGSETGTVTPSADGLYTVKGIKANHRSILITAKGFAPTSVSFMPVAGETVDLGVITLDRGATIRGRVTRNGGGGFPGVAVSASKQSSSGFAIVMMGEREGDPRLSATTNDLGDFEIHNVEVGTFDIKAKFAGFATGSATVAVTKDRDPDRIVIDLFEGGAVSGNVLAPTGTAGTEGRPRGAIVSGGIVTPTVGREKYVALCADNASGISTFTSQWKWAAMASPHRAEIGEDGNYAIENIPAGNYTAVAVWGELTSIQKNVVIRDKDRLTINFRFDIKGSVSGTVTGSDSLPAINMPIELATNWWEDAVPGTSTTTDQSGRYFIKDVPIGTYYVRSRGERRQDRGSQSSRKVEISEEHPNATLDFTVSTANPTVRGTATIDNGGTLKNVILLPRAGTTASMDTIYGTVEPSGEYAVLDVPSGTYLIIFSDNQWSTQQYAASGTLRVPANATEDVVSSWNFRTASVTGVVESSAGDLPAGGEVTAQLLVESQRGWISTQYGSFTSTVKADGSFVFGPIVEGRYSFTAKVPGLAPVTTEANVGSSASVTIRVGQAASSINITIDAIEGGVPAAAPTHGILSSMDFGRVTVTDSNNKRVQLDSNAAFVFGNWQVGTKVTIPNLPAGRYTILLWGSTIEPHTLTVDAKAGEASNYNVSLQRGADVTLTIQNDATEIDAATLAPMIVTLEDSRGATIPFNSGGAVSQFKPNARSQSISGLTAGSYTAVLTLAGYQVARVPVSLSRGQSVTVPVILTKKAE